MEKRNRCIDALKGISGIWICLFHYILAFMPLGYVGWECGVAEADKKAFYFEYFPFSILANGSFPLYVFFALASFITATVYFKNRDEGSIKKQGIKRYFRLMPPVLACTLICYTLAVDGLMFNKELGALAPSNWAGVFYGNDLSFWGAVGSGLYTAFIYGDGGYCSVLWCMNLIFIGSYLTYMTLLLFGGCRGRWFFYAALLGLSFAAPDYAAFLAGIVAADILANFPAQKISNGGGVALIALGLVAGNFPPVWLPSWIPLPFAYALGAFLLLWGFGLSAPAQKAISAQWLCAAGKWSFSLVLVHFPVMMSFSAWVFVCLKEKGWGFAGATAVSWGASMPVLFLATWAFYRLVEIPAEKFAQWVWGKLR